jgi:hypothetical protein
MEEAAKAGRCTESFGLSQDEKKSRLLPFDGAQSSQHVCTPKRPLLYSLVMEKYQFSSKTHQNENITTIQIRKDVTETSESSRRSALGRDDDMNYASKLAVCSLLRVFKIIFSVASKKKSIENPASVAMDQMSDYHPGSLLRR